MVRATTKQDYIQNQPKKRSKGSKNTEILWVCHVISRRYVYIMKKERKTNDKLRYNCRKDMTIIGLNAVWMQGDMEMEQY